MKQSAQKQLFIEQITLKKGMENYLPEFFNPYAELYLSALLWDEATNEQTPICILPNASQRNLMLPISANNSRALSGGKMAFSNGLKINGTIRCALYLRSGKETLDLSQKVKEQIYVPTAFSGGLLLGYHSFYTDSTEAEFKVNFESELMQYSFRLTI